MEKAINEEEFISIIGNEAYFKFVEDIYNLLKESEAYKREDDVVYYIGASPLNETMWFHYEASLFKKDIGDEFGFTRMIITDDLDMTLDRINYAKDEIKKNGGKDGIWINNK